MSSAPLPPLLVANPDDDRGDDPPLRARETVLNHPDYLLRHILAFVPDDSFRLVAPVSRTMRRAYLAAHHNSTRTLLLHAVATAHTAQLWLDDGLPVMPLAVMAARWGRLDVLRYLHDGGGAGWWSPFTPFPDGYDICVAAAAGGHLHVWEWALTNAVAVWNDDMSNAAARDGHLHVLRFARDHNYPMSWQELRWGAMNGHLNVVMWLREQGYPWDEMTCAAAAGGGHLHVLQWVRANGCPWDGDTCAEAAKQGDLPMLQWARANGCDWDARTCKAAAQNGHLYILQWATANGCPWDAAACFQAAMDEGEEEIVQWMITTGNI
jgi:hypothetical protein